METRFDTRFITTANSFEGFRVRSYLGIVRGITVRSRSIVGALGAGLQQIVGGSISIYTEMCEETRQEAFNLMVQHAAEIGANAILAMSYDATELTDGVSEVLAYGTAVVIERIA